MVLTSIFWALFFLPGYALVRRCSPAPRDAGILYTIALGYAGSLLLVSPLSLLCYVLSAPLYVFSTGVALSIAAAAVLLARARADRELWTALRREPLVALAVLIGLLWMQARIGGWLDGDATFHLGRIRVLLEHGFTNRDIYLAEDYFQRVYHTNLLFPLYGSAAQLTHTPYLVTWFSSEAWAKLMVAAGHYTLGYVMTRRRFAAQLFALLVITANSGETYALYPNTLAVGYLLPSMLGFALTWAASALARRETRPGESPASSRGAPVSQWDGHALGRLAALDLVLAQVHGLYAAYAVVLLAPVFLLSWAVGRGRRWAAFAGLASLVPAAPFLVVSMSSEASGPPLEVAPDQVGGDDSMPAVPTAGLAQAPNPRRSERDAIAAGGGHLEKVMEDYAPYVVVFDPRRMGGRASVALGYVALVLALLAHRRQRLSMALLLLVADGLGLLLFLPTVATFALTLFRTPFVIARLSTVLSSLLMLGVCACLAALLTGVPPRARRAGETLMTLSVVALGTQLLGHAPFTFAEHLLAALAPRVERHALLERLLERRALLAEVVPAGATVLTTARFARQVVMLRDCYVLAADRGHTGVGGIDRRRRDLITLNAAETPWQTRARLIAHYDLHLVTFENRWRRRYRWAYQHGRVLGSRAGQDVIALDRSDLDSPAPSR